MLPLVVSDSSRGVGRGYMGLLCQFSSVAQLCPTFCDPMDCKEIQPVHPKGDQPWVFIGRTDVKLKLQNFGQLMQTADSFEKTLILGKTEGGRRRG